MGPLDLNSSITSVIGVIAAFEQNDKAGESDVKSVTAKVEEFVKNNESAILPDKQKAISQLLGKLNDTSNKSGTCKQLTGLINSVAQQTIQKKALSPADEERLINAKWAFKSIVDNPWNKKNIDEQELKTLISTTSELERAEIIKKEFESDDFYNFGKIALISENLKKFCFTDQQLRYEIAQAMAKWDPKRVSEIIQNFELNEENRLQLAKTILEQRSYFEISDYIQKYNFSTAKAQLELAIIKSAYRPLDFFDELDQYNLLTEEDRFALAKHMAQHKTYGAVSRKINALKLTPDHLKSIAEIEAENSSAAFAEYVDKYNIHSEADRLRLAKVILDKDATALVNHLDKFQLEENARSDLALILSKNSSGLVPDISEHIQKFGITNEKVLMEIAEIRLDVRKGHSLCEHIKDFKFSLDAREKLANKILDKQEYLLSAYIQNFDLPHETRFALAKRDLKLFDSGIKNYDLDYESRMDLVKSASIITILNHIKSFNFTPADRLAIAKQAATRSPYELQEQIKNFDLQNESERFDVACIMIDAGGNDIRNFELTPEHQIALAERSAARGHNLKNFRALEIKDEDDRFRIASKLAEKNAFELCREIENFQIESEEKRFALVKQTFKFIQPSTDFNFAAILASKISKFRINTTEYLDEIVRAFLEKGKSYQLCQHLPNFGLSEKQRYNLANELNLKSSSGVHILYFFSNFQFNEVHKLDIAEKLFQNESLNSCLYIQTFDLKPEDNLRFAWIAVRKYTSEFCEKVANFKLPALEQLALARAAALRDGTFPKIGIHNFKLEERESCELLCRTWSSFPEQAAKLEHGNIPPKEFEVLNKEIASSQKEDVKIWWSVFWFVINMCKPEQYKECAALAELIYKFRNPAARYLLTAALLQFNIPAPLTNDSKHKSLFNIIVAPLLKEAGLNETESKKVWAVLGSKKYREASFKEKIIKAMFALLDCRELTGPEKRVLLNHIFEHAKETPAHSALQKLEAIINTESVDLLKESATKEADVKSTKDVAVTVAKQQLKPIDFDAVIKQIFTSKIGLDISSDFGKKYEATFGISRDPTAVVLYAANLSTLPDGERQEALKPLKEFTESVLNGKYPDIRHQVKPNSHLDIVFKSDPKLQNEWQRGATTTIGELYKEAARDLKIPSAVTEKDNKIASAAVVPVQKRDQMTLTLRQKVLTDNHLDPKIYKHFAACLEDLKNCKKALNACKNDQKTAEEALKKQGIAIDTLKPALKNSITLPYFQSKLEEDLINLVTAQPQKRSDLITKLIPNVRSMYGPQAPFASDLELIKSQIEEEKKQAKDKAANVQKPETTHDHYMITDTEAWDDLVLCGTEVAGSCQRIGGDPSYNKCLVGYMLDGKNRIIAIKDPDTGKIIARCVMRLLWDKISQKPVLFQERLYANAGIPNRALKAIDLMFAKRAKELNVQLAKSVPDVDEAALKQIPRYLHDLSSLGSPAPFEYVDAAGKGVTNGVYTISANKIQLVSIE